MAFTCLEIDMSQLSAEVEGLLKGDITALLVKSAMSARECEVVYHNFVNSKGLYKRKDGVPAMMVGANTYLRSASSVISEIQQNNAYAELLFNGTRNIYREVYDCIEDAGYRFRRAYHLRGLHKDECQDNRLHYSACNHPKDINTFG